MERPETVSLTYDKSNQIAEQTLDFFVTLGVEKSQREAIFEEKYKDRVLNRNSAPIYVIGMISSFCKSSSVFRVISALCHVLLIFTIFTSDRNSKKSVG